MTETTSSSSTFGRDTPRLPALQSGSSLKVPEDILELLRKFVGWDKLVDLRKAQLMYTSVLRGHYYPNFNIEEELEKLKGLSSALGCKYDTYAKECEKISMEYENQFHCLVENLVEQVSNIKEMPGYKNLTTGIEKFLIEKALRKKVPEVKLQVEDSDLAIHLEDMRKKLRPMEEKCGEGWAQLGRIDHLRLDVNNFIQILTEVVSVPGHKKRRKQILAELVVSEPVHKKRKKFDRKEVEDSLVKVLNKVGGKTLGSSAVDTEFMKKWDSIVDDFTILLSFEPSTG